MSDLGEGDYPPIGLARSCDPEGELLYGTSRELHGWRGAEGPFPRYQRSDGLLLSPILDRLTQAARRIGDAGDYQGLIVRLRAHVPAGKLGARLVCIDAESGELRALYPDVSMDADRLNRARRVLEPVFPIADAESLVNRALQTVAADPNFARELAGALIARFWASRLYAADRRRAPTDTEYEQWAPLAKGALEDFQQGLQQARRAGFGNGFFLGRSLAFEVAEESTQTRSGAHHGHENGTLLSRFKDWLSGGRRR